MLDAIMLLRSKQDNLLGSNQLSHIPKMSHERRESLNYKSPMALYMGGLAFCTFHAVWMRTFLFDLSWETWSPPDRTQYSTTLLDKAYNNVKKVVDGTLQELVSTGQKLHFILDESTDRRSRRMINLSTVLKPFGSFFLTNKDTKDAKLGAKYFLDWFKAETMEYTGGVLRTIGSMTTDTCATMRLFWDYAEKSPELAHVLIIPCDSHGLQLLIKDLCTHAWFKPILDAAQAIARGFHKAKKQYAILREIQEDVYGKQQALILSVLTRWGTQYHLCRSILKNRDALEKWALRKDTKLNTDNSQKQSILNDSFWTQLNKLCQAIKLIHDQQKISERNNATLGEVIPR
jgi:hypothetical protein